MKSRIKHMVTLQKKTAPGKKLAFKAGSLHRLLGVKAGEKIPARTLAAARAGQFGPAAKKKALFAQNVLVGPNNS